MNDGVYIGWIEGDLEDRRELERLGMKGHMLWKRKDERASGKRGIFSHCVADLETLDRIDRHYSTPNRDSFSFADQRKYEAYLREHGWNDFESCFYCGGGIPFHSLKCPHCYAALKSAY